jgi:probable F420-dependent oxidoreductase
VTAGTLTTGDDALGITIPFDFALHRHLAVFESLWNAGYTEYWTGESAGADAFTPLILAAASLPHARLGTAIVPVFTRGPGLLAMSASSLADVAPGRAVIGLGASTPTIVEGWNAATYTRPLARLRQTVDFLRRALAGERIDQDFGEFAVRRFRLDRVPESPPPIFLAALRPAMLRLAGEVADGVILNWVSPPDVARVVPVANETVPVGGHLEVMTRIFVCPTEDYATVLAASRRLIAQYLSVPAYAELHRWLGREPLLAAMWSAWEAGDRIGAEQAVPEEVVDAVIVHGSPATCARRIREYVAAGVTTPVVRILPMPDAYATVDAAIEVAEAFRSQPG